MTTKMLSSLFAQKTWSNNELFTELAAISPKEHPSALRLAIRTLNHVYVVDRIFRAHLLGEVHGYAATNTEATPELEELQFLVAETDAWFEEYAKKASATQLGERIDFRFTDGDNGTMTREEMLFHVITHGAYHRGGAGQIMKSTSIAPPRDLYTRFLHIQEPSRRRV